MNKVLNRLTPVLLVTSVVLFAAKTAGAQVRFSDNLLKKDDAWFRSDEAKAIADSVIQYQSPQGGWPKSTNLAKPPKSPSDIPPPGRGRANSFDNDATTVPMLFLARITHATGETKYKDSFLRGLDYTLAAQYPNGGWPQFWPLREGYYSQITYNDGAMIRVMEVIRDLAKGDAPYDFVDAERIAKADKAFQLGVECILKTQIRQNGKLTAWCAQHDAKTLEPTWARAYEPPSLSGGESVGIIRFLMEIEEPSDEIEDAIEGAVAWVRSVEMKGWRQERAKNDDGRSERKLVADPEADSLWARFYELKTNRPLYLDRDSKFRYDYSEISYERRSGYSYHGSWGASLLEKDYPRWREKRKQKLHAASAQTTHKPRIVVTTDLGADPDDEQSMVRLLVSANEFDIEGLIVSTGCWKKEQSDTKMLDKLVDAYAQCYDNLKVHAEGFPTPEYLRSISVMGQKGYGMSDVGNGKDSPGSDLIIESIDRDDPRPVWVGAWGGANNIAQAIWKVKETRSKEELSKFLSKLRVFDILGQDDAGAWIAKNYPEVLYIRATGVYGWQPPKNGDYQKNDIQSHGPLGAVYPDTKWATEGDTPAFMHVYPNGLNDPDKIDQGGWGGRFSLTKKTGIKSMRAVKEEERVFDPYEMFGNTSDGAKSIKRWSKGYDNDFAARMDWSITKEYSDANHHPVAVVNGDRTRRVLKVSAAPGAKVELSAEGSSDPDIDTLNYVWSFYEDASSYEGSIDVVSDSASATVSVPSNAAGKSIHIILELHDDGTPQLYAYRRLIINVK